MQPHDIDFDVVIMGGGLVGASLALALADDWRVALIERQPPTQPPTDWDARVYAISPGNRAWLARLGGWPDHEARVGQITRMAVFGDAGGEISFDAAAMGQDTLASVVENRVLQWSIWQALSERAARPAFGTLKTVAPGAHAVQLEDDAGRVLRARLLVGADGAHSSVRDAAGIDFTRTPYPQRAVVANFACTQPHRGLARQWFRPDGILAWLPLPGQRLSIVWSTHPEYADELCALPPDTLAERVAAAGGYALGTFTSLTAAAAFPLALGRARQVVGPRVALVGDAAHTIHPLAGQGVNLGFGDARALVAALRPGGDAGDPVRLARYARARKEDVWLMQTVCDGLQRLFAAEPPAIGLLRNTGLSLVNRLGVLKRPMMARAFA